MHCLRIINIAHPHSAQTFYLYAIRVNDVNEHSPSGSPHKIISDYYLDSAYKSHRRTLTAKGTDDADDACMRVCIAHAKRNVFYFTSLLTSCWIVAAVHTNINIAYRAPSKFHLASLINEQFGSRLIKTRNKIKVNVNLKFPVTLCIHRYKHNTTTNRKQLPPFRLFSISALVGRNWDEIVYYKQMVLWSKCVECKQWTRRPFLRGINKPKQCVCCVETKERSCQKRTRRR